MPPTTQRRNAAYLNRLNSRFGPLGRGLDDPATETSADIMPSALPTWASCFA